MKKYLIILEKTKDGYSAYIPDVPGCVATGKTVNQTEKNIRSAVDFHFEGLRLEKERIPTPHTQSLYLQVA